MAVGRDAERGAVFAVRLAQLRFVVRAFTSLAHNIAAFGDDAVFLCRDEI